MQLRFIFEMARDWKFLSNSVVDLLVVGGSSVDLVGAKQHGWHAMGTWHTTWHRATTSICHNHGNLSVLIPKHASECNLLVKVYLCIKNLSKATTSVLVKSLHIERCAARCGINMNLKYTDISRLHSEIRVISSDLRYLKYFSMCYGTHRFDLWQFAKHRPKPGSAWVSCSWLNGSLKGYYIGYMNSWISIFMMFEIRTWFQRSSSCKAHSNRLKILKHSKIIKIVALIQRFWLQVCCTRTS